METKLSVWGKIKAYRLKNNVIVMVFLAVVFVLSFVVYLQPEARKNEVVSNIAMAIFTSLLATIFAMCAEIYVQFKTNENDQFLEDIHTFGIANLNKNKEVLLRDLLHDCERIIWISGYRLIMTDHLKSEIGEAIRRGANVKAILCPPWTTAFQLVYGKREKVMDHYFQVLHAIDEAARQGGNYDIRFTEKPLFSDTYKVDLHLVTGPYMHNKDKEYNRIMAKDFFSYNLVKKSKLYNIVEGEYLTLCEEAVCVLNWERFREAYKISLTSDLRETEKIELLKNACDVITQEMENCPANL